MKANELRIGNWVNAKPMLGDRKPTQIIEFNNEGINIVDGGYLEYLDTVQPIPLTEEWLIKFGFVYDEKNDNYKIGNYYFVSGEFTFWLFRDEDQLLKNGNSDMHAKCILLSEPKHVHQLQNLYFALTNEELTINV